MTRKLPICRLLLLALSTLILQGHASPATFFPGIGLGEGEFFGGVLYSKICSGERHQTPEHTHTTLHQETYLFTYGLLPKLFAIGVVPYSRNEQHTVIDGQPALRKSHGLGDITFGLTWLPYVCNEIGSTSRILLTAGFQAPTGKFNETDQFGMLPRGLQSGTGTWTLPLQGYYIFQNLSHELIGGCLYNVQFKGHGYRYGDNATLVAAWNPRLLPWILPERGYYSEVLMTFEFDYIWAQRDKTHRQRVLNTGGETITFSPGLRYNHKYFTLACAYIHPVRTRLNDSPGLPQQLVPKPWRSFALQIGGRY